MNPSDKNAFKELMDGLCEAYGKDKMSTMGLRVYFEALNKYSMDQVFAAASAHLTSPKYGTFFPKPADIIRGIEGGELTHDEIISAARLKNTPLGILCRIHIGHWDLDNQKDMFYLKQRAQECLDLLPGWKARAAQGEYTDHEISIMIKHQVDPKKPFNTGLAPPSDLPRLEDRINKVATTPRHLRLVEPVYDGENQPLVADKSVSVFLEKLSD